MNEIIEVLVKRGYEERIASSVAANLSKVSDCLKEALDKWIADETETDFEAEGYTILGLKQKFEMTYPAALLSIDWIIKDPKVAIECIKRGIR